MAKRVCNTQVYLGGVDISAHVLSIDTVHRIGEPAAAQVEMLVDSVTTHTDTLQTVIRLQGPEGLTATTKKRTPKYVGTLCGSAIVLTEWIKRHPKCTCTVTPKLGSGWAIKVMDTCPQEEHRL